MECSINLPGEILQRICLFLSESEALQFCSSLSIPFPSSFWRKKAREEFGISKKQFLLDMGFTPKERYLALVCSFGGDLETIREGKVLPCATILEKWANEQKFETLARCLRQRVNWRSLSNFRLEIVSSDWDIFLSRRQEDIEEIISHFANFFSNSRSLFPIDRNMLCQAINRSWSCHFQIVERRILSDFLTNYTFESGSEILSNFFPVQLEPYLYFDEERNFTLGYCEKFRVNSWLQKFLDSSLLSFQIHRIEFLLNLGEKISFEGWENFCGMSQIPHQKTKKEILIRYFQPQQFNEEQIAKLLEKSLLMADFDSAEFFLEENPNLIAILPDYQEETLLSKYLRRKKHALSE